MKSETGRLLRYLDGELSPDEAEAFRARLSQSPELQRQLHEMRRVGQLVRGWAGRVEARAGVLLEPTMARVQAAERKRRRHAALSYGLVAVLLVALPWSRRPAPSAAFTPSRAEAAKVVGAAIERVEATDQQAQVFVVGSSSTPVVWLADEAQDDEGSAEQGPG